MTHVHLYLVILSFHRSDSHTRKQQWHNLTGCNKPSVLWITEGPFQSDALLVPENCLFDHIHNQTKCWEFSKWNLTASQSCLDRDMQLRSFAMLLPCGISLFSGVEFVCCPKHFKGESVGILRERKVYPWCSEPQIFRHHYIDLCIDRTRSCSK